METIVTVLIILLDILAFITGISLGRLYSLKKQERKSRQSVKKNNDWHTLLYYTPGEPTDKSADKYNRNKFKGD